MANTRRAFLGLLGGAAALTLDPERALWVPGKRVISIPKVGVWVVNVVTGPSYRVRRKGVDEYDNYYFLTTVEPPGGLEPRDQFVRFDIPGHSPVRINHMNVSREYDRYGRPRPA